MSLSPANNPTAKVAFKDRIIPWYFVMAFAVIFSVNGLFVYFATSTMPGVVQKNHFEVGVDYNHVIAKSEAQQIRGWQSTLTAENGELNFVIKNKEGRFIEQASVMATLSRPVGNYTPQEIILTYAGEGRYSIPFNYPYAGQWTIQIDALWNEQPYHQTFRMIAK